MIFLHEKNRIELCLFTQTVIYNQNYLQLSKTDGWDKITKGEKIMNENLIIQKGSEPWFAGEKIANFLGFKNPLDALKHYVSDENKSFDVVVSEEQSCPICVINESGLYELILSSDSPIAKEFQYWIFHDVLPSIRRNGVYMTEDFMKYALKHPDFTIYFLQNYKAESQASIKQKL